METIGALLVLLIMLAFLGLYVWSAVWAYGDAEQRGKSGCLVALLILLLSWPISILAWLVFRPEKKMPPYDRE